jgi:hypothetical protein
MNTRYVLSEPVTSMPRLLLQLIRENLGLTITLQRHQGKAMGAVYGMTCLIMKTTHPVLVAQDIACPDLPMPTHCLQ